MATEQELLDKLKWVTTQLRSARATVAAHEAATRDPIAVVGIGCRFPGGVAGPEDLWTLLADERDATSEVPSGRGWDNLPWYHPDPDHEGTSYVRRGGFLDDVDLFDSGFFGISPREALAMDPQQRLLLETSWEAFERAGIDPSDLEGSDVGVFAGIAYNGYGGGSPEHAGHGLTGASPAVAAGRIAYTFGLHGPAVSIDTMCSSSLVAIHLACRSLRAGECSAALAAGAMVIADPTEFVEFSRQGALSADGRCRPFADGADGTAWAEGVGTLLLEPLSRAQELGHPVWAVLRGSAVNQDGRSNGLTAPNAAAQRSVIASALTQADLEPHDIDMVESHGTGTRLGDPIEARALADVYGVDRPGGPLLLGSVKSNFGHAQAAGGVAGLIKTIMALRHATMPATLHAQDPSTEVDWDRGVRLLHSATPWPIRSTPRRAAVSAFGASGTNAHMIVEEAPATEAGEPSTSNDGPIVLALSGRNAVALRLQAGRLAAALPGLVADVGPARLAAALAARHRFTERAALVMAPRTPPIDCARQLARFADGEPDTSVVAGTAIRTPRIAFVFPGQGAQWEGMAADLIDRAPAFTAALRECEEALAPHVSWTVRDVLRGVPGAPELRSVDVVQPVLWAVNVALAAQWRAEGITPTAVIGHSQGEVAAAVVAGAIDVADGARIIARRSAMIAGRLAGAGAMASIRMSGPDRDTVLARHPGVEIAGITSPTSSVVSGDRVAVEQLVADAPDHARLIDVDYASHTSHVDVLRTELGAAVGTVTPLPTDIAIYSTVSGARMDPTGLDTAHWWSNLREPVQFERAVRAAAAQGTTLFVEVSPHPVLVGAVTEILDAAGADGACVETLRRGQGDESAMRRAVAAAWTHGAPARIAEPVPGPSVADRLPTYAFARSSYWIPPRATTDAANGVPRLTHRWVPAAPVLDPAPTVTVLCSEVDPDLATPVVAALGGESVARLVCVPHDAAPDDLLGRFPSGESPIVSLLALTAGDPVRLTLPLLQASARSHTGPVWVITRGAVATEPGEVTDPAQAAVWGLVRVAALEAPDTIGGLVDLPGDTSHVPSGLAGTVASAPGSPGHEDEIALRGDTRLARRIVPAVAGGEPLTPPKCVVVTGATGSLGREVAHRLVDRGSRRIVVPTRRSVDSPEIIELCDGLRGRGAEAVAVTCDLTDPTAVTEFAEHHRHEVDEIVHTAQRAVLAPLADLTAEDLTAALDLGSGAAERLSAAFGPTVPLTTFASVTGLWGAADHAVMAVTGPALEAVATRARAAGGAVSALYWGVWAVPSDAAAESGDARPARHGLPPIDPAAAADALDVARGARDTGVAVVDVAWDRFTSLFHLRRPTRRFDEIPEVRAAADDRPADTEAAGELRARLADMPAADRPDLVLDVVRSLCAAVLGHPDATAINPRTPLRELGFDSLMAVDLRNRLQVIAGAPLRATVVFDFPSAQALARHLGDVVCQSQGPVMGLADTVAHLEAALIDAPADDPDLPSLIRRLEEAVASWRRAGVVAPDARAPDGPPDDGDDEALLSFIRDQFGKPGA